MTPQFSIGPWTSLMPYFAFLWVRSCMVKPFSYRALFEHKMSMLDSIRWHASFGGTLSLQNKQKDASKQSRDQVEKKKVTSQRSLGRSGLLHGGARKKSDVQSMSWCCSWKTMEWLKIRSGYFHRNRTENVIEQTKCKQKKTEKNKSSTRRRVLDDWRMEKVFSIPIQKRKTKTKKTRRQETPEEFLLYLGLGKAKEKKLR